MRSLSNGALVALAVIACCTVGCGGGSSAGPSESGASEAGTDAGDDGSLENDGTTGPDGAGTDASTNDGGHPGNDAGDDASGDDASATDAHADSAGPDASTNDASTNDANADGATPGGDAGPDASSGPDSGTDAGTSKDATAPGNDASGVDAGGNCLPDAGGAMGVCIEELAAVSDEPYAMAVNGTGVYWVTSSAVVMAPLGGGGATTLTSGLEFGSDIAVDDTDAYYMDGVSISKIPAGGGTPTPLLTNQSALSQLALDATEIYFTESGPAAVSKIGKDGTALTTLASGSSLYGSPGSLAVDSTNVYFESSFADESDIALVGKDGTGLTTLSTQQPDAWYVRVDATGVYWMDLTAPASLLKLPFGSSQTTPLANFPEPTGLATDGTTLYVAAAGVTLTDGVIDRLPVGGGVTNALASDLPSPRLLAIDATSAYWFNEVQVGGSFTWTLVRATPR